MRLLGLNSPEIFIILVVLLSILGPKRIEKGFLLFKKILKFLLSQDDFILEKIKVKDNSKFGSDGPKENQVKEESIEAEVKSEETKSDIKEEIIEAEVKSEETKSDVKEEIIEAEVKSEETKSEVKE